jgi:hypothetical protein
VAEQADNAEWLLLPMAEIKLEKVDLLPINYFSPSWCYPSIIVTGGGRKKQSAAAMLDESIKVPSARPPDCLYCFITSILRQSNQKYDYSASMHSLYGYIYTIYICTYVYVLM